MSDLTLFDSHVHLGAPHYRDDLDQVIERARAAGVDQMVVIGAGYGLEGCQRAIELARSHEGLYAVVGIHPHEAGDVAPGDLDRIVRMTAEPEVLAWGEIGLDFFRDWSPREAQRQVFRDQIRLARGLDLPIVIHSRAAEDESLAILDEERAWDGRVLIHCFSHDWEFARRVLERGGYLSVPGVVTYKNARELRDAIPRLPNESLLLETDGPFLAPVPRRGKRNEPALLVHTAREVARLKGLALRDVARASTRAAREFYGLDRGEEREGAIAYQIRDSIYLNLTNRCTLHCSFCHKFRDWSVAGHYLNLRGYRPSVEDVVLAARLAVTDHAATRLDVDRARTAGQPGADLDGVAEVAFVGYGEPTQRLDVVLEAARRLREHEGVGRLRLDTDGLTDLREGRDVVPQLAAAFDAITVSINAADGPTYAELCRSPHGERGWETALAFLERCVDAGIPWVQGSVVGVPGLDIEACAERIEATGARFRERVHHVMG
jgi:TatD DNase family protein